MGGRSVFILAAVAVLLLGLCAVAMSRLGGERAADLDASGTDSTEDVLEFKSALNPKAAYDIAEQTEEGINLFPTGGEMADQLNDPEADATDDLMLVDELIRIHLDTFKSIPPGGENVDIMQAMTGRNERSLAIIPPGHKVLSEIGELLDRWGTPYHFHPVSRNRLEIRSAGPDRQLWNEDDVMLTGGDDSEE